MKKADQTHRSGSKRSGGIEITQCLSLRENADSTKRESATASPVSISLSKDFKVVPSSTRQPADVMVFSNPKPYHMGFYAPHPPSPKKLIDIFLSSTVHGNGGLGGPRYLPQGDFSGSVSYYRLQEPCHE